MANRLITMEVIMPKKMDKFDFRMENVTDKTADIYMYGPVMNEKWWDEEDGIVPTEILKALNGVKGKDLNIHLHSGGGHVVAAMAIYTQLANHEGKKTIIIDGLAASAATVIAMAGDEVRMSESGIFMIHNASGISLGNASQMRKDADRVEKMSNIALELYANKTGKSQDEIKQMMDDETWMTAKEAKELGFIDSVISKTENEPQMMADGAVMWCGIDVTEYKNRLPAVLNAVGQDATKTKPKPNNQPKGESQMDELTLAMLKEKFPDVYQQAISEAVAQAKEEAIATERARMQAIDEIAEPGHEELVKKAKYDLNMTAGDFAIEAIKANKANLSMMQTQRQQEITESGVNDVTGVGIASAISGTGKDATAKEEAELNVFAEAAKLLNGDK